MLRSRTRSPVQPFLDKNRRETAVIAFHRPRQCVAFPKLDAATASVVHEEDKGLGIFGDVPKRDVLPITCKVSESNVWNQRREETRANRLDIGCRVALLR